MKARLCSLGAVLLSALSLALFPSVGRAATGICGVEPQYFWNQGDPLVAPYSAQQVTSMKDDFSMLSDEWRGSMGFSRRYQTEEMYRPIHRTFMGLHVLKNSWVSGADESLKVAYGYSSRKIAETRSSCAGGSEADVRIPGGKVTLMRPFFYDANPAERAAAIYHSGRHASAGSCNGRLKYCMHKKCRGANGRTVACDDSPSKDNPYSKELKWLVGFYKEGVKSLDSRHGPGSLTRRLGWLVSPEVLRKVQSRANGISQWRFKSKRHIALPTGVNLDEVWNDPGARFENPGLACDLMFKGLMRNQVLSCIDHMGRSGFVLRSLSSALVGTDVVFSGHYVKGTVGLSWPPAMAVTEHDFGVLLRAAKSAGHRPRQITVVGGDKYNPPLFSAAFVRDKADYRWELALADWQLERYGETGDYRVTDAFPYQSQSGEVRYAIVAVSGADYEGINLGRIGAHGSTISGDVVYGGKPLAVLPYPDVYGLDERFMIHFPDREPGTRRAWVVGVSWSSLESSNRYHESRGYRLDRIYSRSFRGGPLRFSAVWVRKCALTEVRCPVGYTMNVWPVDGATETGECRRVEERRDPHPECPGQDYFQGQMSVDHDGDLDMCVKNNYGVYPPRQEVWVPECSVSLRAVSSATIKMPGIDHCEEIVRPYCEN